MWSEDDCTDVEDDLSSLADVVYLCGGHANEKGRDYEGLNACMDAIRALMLNETHVPDNPISLLLDELQGSQIMVQMLAGLLVHGKCARDGRTKKWLEQNGTERGWNYSFVRGCQQRVRKEGDGRGSARHDGTLRVSHTRSGVWLRAGTPWKCSERYVNPANRIRGYNANRLAALVDRENMKPLHQATIPPTRLLRPDHSS